MSQLACMQATDCPANGFCRLGVCECGDARPVLCPADDVSPVGACSSLQNDPDHCGACDNHCGPDAGCLGDQCTEPPLELVSVPGCGSMQLAAHGETLYWTERATGKVRSMPLAGGDVTDVATAQVAPFYIAVDDAGVYWTTDGVGPADATASELGGESQVFAQPLPLTAEPALKLGPWRITTYRIRALGVHAGKLYYSLGHELREVTLATGTDVLVGAALSSVSPPMTGGFAQGLAVDDTRVFWRVASEVQSDDLAPIVAPFPQVDATGFASVTSVSGVVSAPLALDDTWVYLAAGNGLYRAKRDGSTPTPELILHTPGYALISAFTIAGGSAFLSDGQGFIIRHPLTPAADPDDDRTEEGPVFARNQPAPSSIVALQGRLYWATEDCKIRSSAIL